MKLLIANCNKPAERIYKHLNSGMQSESENYKDENSVFSNNNEYCTKANETMNDSKICVVTSNEPSCIITPKGLILGKAL